MRSHSKQTDRLRLSGGLFRSTIPEFLRQSHLASHAQSVRYDARAENCSTRRPPLSARRSFLDSLREARPADAAGFCPASGGNTACLLPFLLGFWDKYACANESHDPRVKQGVRLPSCHLYDGGCEAIAR